MRRRRHVWRSKCLRWGSRWDFCPISVQWVTWAYADPSTSSKMEMLERSNLWANTTCSSAHTLGGLHVMSMCHCCLRSTEHTGSRGSACYSSLIYTSLLSIPASWFPLNSLSIFPSPVGCVFWLGYFFWNKHSPLKQRIIICPHKFSQASLNLSSATGRLLTVFLLTGMVLNTRDGCFSNWQQWKPEISWKWKEWVCVYPWTKRGLGLCTSGELNLSQEASTKCALFHCGGFTWCCSQWCSWV